MPKIVSVLCAGLLAALIALQAQPGAVTWRSGLVAAIAFLGAIGIPAVHQVGSSSSTSPATPGIPQSAIAPDGATAAEPPPGL